MIVCGKKTSIYRLDLRCSSHLDLAFCSKDSRHFSELWLHSSVPPGDSCIHWGTSTFSRLRETSPAAFDSHACDSRDCGVSPAPTFQKLRAARWDKQAVLAGYITLWGWTSGWNWSRLWRTSQCPRLRQVSTITNWLIFATHCADETISCVCVCVCCMVSLHMWLWAAVAVEAIMLSITLYISVVCLWDALFSRWFY